MSPVREVSLTALREIRRNLGSTKGIAMSVLFFLGGLVPALLYLAASKLQGGPSEAPDVAQQAMEEALKQKGIAADVDSLYPGRTVAEVEAAYERHMRAQTATIDVNPEGREALATLRAGGLKIACVTNTHGRLAEALLEAAGLVGALDAVRAAGPALREKPAPDLLLSAMAAVGERADEALMVGDSRYDEEAAAAARVRFVKYVMRTKASLREALTAAGALAPARR